VTSEMSANAQSAEHPLVGGVLLPNTTISKASKLISSAPTPGFVRPEINAVSIFDLMMLIESSILYDQIYYLPGNLAASHEELNLRTILADEGILKEAPKKDDHNLIGRSLVASLGTAGDFRSHESDHLMQALRIYAEDDSNRVVGDHSSRRMNLDANFSATGDKEFGINGSGTIGINGFGSDSFGRIEDGRSFDEAARSLIYFLENAGTGEVEGSTSALRVMYYIFASEHYKIPFIAPVAARKMQQRFPNYFKPSARTQIYEAIASALKATVSTVMREFEDSVVYIPPFSALVLDRAAAPEGIPSEIFALRAEYSEFRRRMHDLECARVEARSLNERISILSQIQDLGREVARPFEQTSRMKFDTALRYIPSTIDLAANPTSPTQWAKTLLTMPVDALVNWYRRRPVAKLVSDTRTIGEMSDYGALLAKHFGGDLYAYHLEYILEDLRRLLAEV